MFFFCFSVLEHSAEFPTKPVLSRQQFGLQTISGKGGNRELVKKRRTTSRNYEFSEKLPSSSM